MKINFDYKWPKSIRVKNTPFLSSSLTQKQETRFAQLFNILNARYDNLFPVLDPRKDILLQFDLMLRKRIQNLCQGKFNRPAKLEKDLKCLWLHHNNPYLILGPFKYEFMHKNPEIAVIHNFASSKEAELIRNSARGHMKSTPYTIGTKGNSYSKLRTSKVMYMNEKLVPRAMTLSKKITLATKYLMKEDRYASENFQIMNYGIGGRISGHLDSTGKILWKLFYPNQILFKYSCLQLIWKIIFNHQNMLIMVGIE